MRGNWRKKGRGEVKKQSLVGEMHARCFRGKERVKSLTFFGKRNKRHYTINESSMLLGFKLVD